MGNPKKTTPQEKHAQIQKLKKQGCTPMQIVQISGYSFPTVKRYSNNPPPDIKETYVGSRRNKKNIALELYKQGVSVSEIVKEVKTTVKSVNLWLFRDEAIRLLSSGESIYSVSQTLNVMPKTISGWGNFDKKVRVKYSEEFKRNCLEKAKLGKSYVEIARELNVSWSVVKYLILNENEDLLYIPPDIKENILIEWGDNSKKRKVERISPRRLAIKYKIPIQALRNLLDLPERNKPRKRTEKEIIDAINKIQEGTALNEVAKKIGITLNDLTEIYQKALIEGRIDQLKKRKSKSEDEDFEWIKLDYPELIDWQPYCVSYVKSVEPGFGDTVNSFSLFFKFLTEYKLPRLPQDFLKRGNIYPNFLEITCGTTATGASRNNRVSSFLDWVLKSKEFSHQDALGDTFPSFEYSNPIPYVSGIRKGNTGESPKVVMPFWLIKNLRNTIVQGENFSDWTWAQSLLGRKQLDGFNIGPDWYEVSKDLIDESDLDCVFRVRKNLEREILEMWSPVRWVLALVKLQTPARLGQTRMSDSGEADTWFWNGGVWVLNSSSLTLGTIKKPWKQGIFRKINTDLNSMPILYYNTNKTLDIGVESTEKGMECPWPQFQNLQDDPYYWLRKLRDWQMKYNPIKEPIPWGGIPTSRRLAKKTAIKLSEYLPTCFLFRTPETPSENIYPISAGMFDKTWDSIMGAYEKILINNAPKYDDGTPIIDPSTGEKLSIKLVDSATGGALTTPHGLRVSLITHLVLDGDVPPATMMKIVGHSRLVMTIYYTKVGLKQMENAINDAYIEIEKSKNADLIRDLKSREGESIRDKVVFNADDWKTVLPVNIADRNPIGWLEMHDGICLAGGNTGPLDGNSSVPGCHNGGKLIRSLGTVNGTYSSVPGGIKNCTRCRWKCAGKKHLYGLHTTYNNRSYHRYKAEEKAIVTERERNQLLVEKASIEAKGELFTKVRELKLAERLHEAAMQRTVELWLDIIMTEKMIDRVMSLPDETDSRLPMALQGDEFTAHTIIEDINSELFVLAQINADLELYPDLDAGTAIYEYAQILDKRLAQEHHPLVFAFMSEAEKLAATNAFMRNLERAVNPKDSFFARRGAVKLLERNESLADLLGVNIEDLLEHGSKSTSGESVFL
jgi:transposase-like protein